MTDRKPHADPAEQVMGDRITHHPRKLSDDAWSVIAEAVRVPLNRLDPSLTSVVMAATNATLPDGRTIADALDALPEVEAERDALREALGDLLPELVAHEKDDDFPACFHCGKSWPCPAERARLLLACRTDGDDGAGIMHGVDW